MLKNSVKLIGNVGKDPEVKYLENSSVVANFTLATSEPYKNKKGEKCEHTEWHNLVVWGEQAKLIEKYVKKGKRLAIEGKLRTRMYEKGDQKHYVTEILVTDFIFLDKPAAANASGNSAPDTRANNDVPENDELSDLPF